MTQPDLGFTHRFVPAERPRLPTLLLLHGTGGDENDLIPLGQRLLPGAALLSPRGKVLENGMPRYFRRIAEGVFDLEDLGFRTAELAAFVKEACEAYDLDANRVIAVGYSNGANIAANLLLRHPESLLGGVLFHALAPDDPVETPALQGARVFVTGGELDPLVTAPQTGHLDSLLRAGGADVRLHWEEGGHMLMPAEVEQARAWLQGWLEEAPAVH